MSALPFAFAYPAILGALIALPVIWWLLRLTPPRPQAEVFPPLKILATVLKREETPAQSPWWLTLLRMLLAAAIIFAIADPVFNPRTGSLASGGPLVLFVDNSWASAPDWERRVATVTTSVFLRPYWHTGAGSSPGPSCASGPILTRRSARR